MNVTRDIVRDLLPVYAAGEASEDSRRAVEGFLASDPDLAREAAEFRDAEAPGSAVAVPVSPPAGARAALERTRRLLRRRTWLMAGAILASTLPFTFVFDDAGLRFLLIRDAPRVAAACLVAAVALWVAFGLTVRRLRVSGL